MLQKILIHSDVSKIHWDNYGKTTVKNRKNNCKSKHHTIIDVNRDLTQRIHTTITNQDDRLVDLSKAGEIIHQERGYLRVPYKGFSSTMK